MSQNTESVDTFFMVVTFKWLIYMILYTYLHGILFNYSVASYNDCSCKLLASLKLRSVLCAGLRDDLDLSNLNGTNKIVKTYKQVKDKHVCSHWEDILLSDALYRIEAAGSAGAEFIYYYSSLRLVAVLEDKPPRWRVLPLREELQHLGAVCITSVHCHSG